jgi:hypothetical protein
MNSIERALLFWRRRPGVGAWISVGVFVLGWIINFCFWFGPSLPGPIELVVPLMLVSGLVFTVGGAVAFARSIYLMFEITPSTDPKVWDDKIPKKAAGKDL